MKLTKIASTVLALALLSSSAGIACFGKTKDTSVKSYVNEAFDYVKKTVCKYKKTSITVAAAAVATAVLITLKHKDKHIHVNVSPDTTTEEEARVQNQKDYEQLQHLDEDPNTTYSAMQPVERLETEFSEEHIYKKNRYLLTAGGDHIPSGIVEDTTGKKTDMSSNTICQVYIPKTKDSPIVVETNGKKASLEPEGKRIETSTKNRALELAFLISNSREHSKILAILMLETWR